MLKRHFLFAGCSFFLLLGCIFLLGWQAQTHLLLKGDVIWLTHLAELSLQGGSYIKDYYEINPPMSFYIYLPAAFAIKTFNIAFIPTVRQYILLLIALSLTLSHPLLKRLYPSDNFSHGVLLLSLAAIYTLLPSFEFGQREHLSLLLTVPYVLALTNRINKTVLPPSLLIIIGLIAGIGFVIKPFFLLPFALLELYYGWVKKKFFAFIRLESCLVIFVCATYVSWIIIQQPEYLKTVVPIAKQFYYSSHHYSLSLLLLHQSVLYCFLPYLFYIGTYRAANTNRPLLTLLLIYLTGYFLVYAWQGIPWYYHIYPVIGVACFFLVVASCEHAPKFQTISAALLAAIAIIFWLASMLYGVNQKMTVSSLVHYLHQQANQKNVYFLSAKAAYMVSVLEHANTNHTTRLQFHNWLNCYYQCPPALLEKGSFYDAYQQTHQFFTTLLAEDINKTKPALILVDGTSYTTQYGAKQLDLLALLKKNPAFVSAWQPYRFITVLTQPEDDYVFKVYQRASPDKRI